MPNIYDGIIWCSDLRNSVLQISSIVSLQLRQSMYLRHNYTVIFNTVSSMSHYGFTFISHSLTTFSSKPFCKPSLLGGALLGNIGPQRNSKHQKIKELSCYPTYGTLTPGSDYCFHKVVLYNSVSTADQAILVDIPLQQLLPQLQKSDMVHLASMHQISFSATSKLNKQVIIKQILEHKYVTCSKLISAFIPIRTIQSLPKRWYNCRKSFNLYKRTKFLRMLYIPFLLNHLIKSYQTRSVEDFLRILG